MSPSEVILNSRYQLEKELGRGGFSITWLAHPKKSKQLKLVVKELQLEKLADWQALEQFEREAQLLANLDHPCIPDFVDFLEEQTPAGKRLYLIQEWIDGQDLAAMIQSGKRFSEAEAREIAKKIAGILKYLHSLSPPVIHRDLKPGNIMLRKQDQQVFLIDFGAVRGPNQTANGLTMTGTAGFMPLEQIEGKAVPASDLYALGMSLIQILSHQEPSALPKKGLKPNFRPHVNISERFAEIIERLIEPDVSKRYPSAEALLRALADLEAPPAPGPLQTLKQHWKPLAGSLLLLAGLGWCGLHQPSKPGASSASASPSGSLPLMSAGEYRLQGNAYYDADQCALAVPYYTEALKGLPNDAETWFKRGYCQSRLEHHAEAAADYAQALKVNPNVYPETTEHNLGYQYYQLENYQEALKYFQAQLKRDPKHLSSLNYLGLCLHELQRDDEALKAYNSAIAVDSKYRYPYANRGRLYYEQGKLDLALADYKQSVSLDPKYALPFYYEAELYYDRSQYTDCIAAATQAIANSSPYPSAHNMRGLCYHGLKKYELAISDYKIALQQSPNYAVAWYNIGLAQADAGQLEQAETAYLEAIKIRPDYHKPLNNLGYIYERQGKLQPALEYYSRAIQAQPQDLYYANRANVYRLLKQCPEAQADWAQACSLGRASACQAKCTP